MPGQFDGKVAFITGAASGIGREAALKFAQGGARVAVADISEAGGRETVAAIAAIGGTAKFFPCDVSDRSRRRLRSKVRCKEFGRLDCAFNNAGIFGPRAAGVRIFRRGFRARAAHPPVRRVLLPQARTDRDAPHRRRRYRQHVVGRRPARLRPRPAAMPPRSMASPA